MYERKPREASRVDSGKKYTKVGEHTWQATATDASVRQRPADTVPKRVTEESDVVTTVKKIRVDNLDSAMVCKAEWLAIPPAEIETVCSNIEDLHLCTSDAAHA